MIFKNGLDALILAALRDRELHGYAIAKRIREESAGTLRFGEGQLYPALHRLEECGYLAAGWEPQEGKPPRKVYSITDAGLAELESQKSKWAAFSESVDRVLAGRPAKVVRHV